MPDTYIPHTGAAPRKKDNRDLPYAAVVGTGKDLTPDFKVGYNAFEDVGLNIITQDQGSSLSCTEQTGKSYARRLLYWLKAIVATDELSARRHYPFVRLPGGGAVIFDAIRMWATEGAALESEIHDYMTPGRVPPTEAFMSTLPAPLTDEQKARHKKLDKFSVRIIPGKTSDITLFAHAVLNCKGAAGGFTGTNKGWCRPIVRAPEAGEGNRWGHAVDLCAFGELDVDVDGMPKGTLCMFTPNSWGGRWAIPEGRWKGLQGIPVDYFTASGGQNDPATGQPAYGIFVDPSVVLVPDDLLPPGQAVTDFLQRNDLRLAQDSENTGAFGLIKGGKLLLIRPFDPSLPDGLAKCLSTWAMKNNGTVSVPKQMWTDIVSAGLAEFKF